jgi:hypothetical protein
MNAMVKADAMDMAIHEAEELFIRAGKAKVKAEASDMRRKRVRAALFVKYKGQGKGAGESEQFAEADPVYEAACVDWELAAYDAETLRAQAEAKRMKFDAWRTANARAVKALQKAGVCVARVRFTADGFEVVAGQPEEQNDSSWFKEARSSGARRHEAKKTAPRPPEEGEGQNLFLFRHGRAQAERRSHPCRLPDIRDPNFRRLIRTPRRSGRKKGAERQELRLALPPLRALARMARSCLKARSALRCLHLGYANENFRSEGRGELAAVHHH